MAQIAYVNWDGLVYYDSKIKEYIKDKLEECVKFHGEAKRDQLPDPSYETLNFMYVLSEDVVADEDFKNPGVIYPKGTIVQVIDFNNVYLYDSIYINTSANPDVDLSNYYTKEEIDAQLYSFTSTIDSINDELARVSNQSASNEVKLLMVDSELVDLNDRIDNLDIPSIDGLATEEYVDEKTEGYTHSYEITQIEMGENWYENEYKDNITIKAATENSYSKIEALSADGQYSDTNYILLETNGEGLKSSIKMEANPNDAARMEIVTGEAYIHASYVEVDSGSISVTGDVHFAGDVSINQEKVATEEYVQTAINSIEIPEQDLSGYALKTDIPTKVSSLENDSEFVSKSYVDEAIASIDLPSIDTSNFATKDDLASKADTILFTEDYYVNNALGLFEKDESVKGLSIQELFIKLLNLKQSIKYSIKFIVDGAIYEEAFYEENEPIKLPEIDPVKEGYSFDGWKVNGIYLTSAFVMPAYNVEAEAAFIANPVTPDDNTLIGKIISNKLPMYSINNEKELAEIPFQIIDSNAEPETSGFIVKSGDAGEIIEAGYQDITILNDEMYYIIALPKEIDYNTMITIQSWDPDIKEWRAGELALTNDPDIISELCDEVEVDISHIDQDKYTIWISEDTCTGSKLRYLIKEVI